MTYVLGVSAFYHDSAAALIDDGKVISAIQEERLTRIKHDHSFPFKAINQILSDNKLSLSQVDYVVFYEKPFLKFERLIETYLSYMPRGFISFFKSMPLWLKEKLFQKKIIINYLKEIDPNFGGEIYFSKHHLSHAASAFYCSEFEKAAILTLDGTGEWETTTISIGEGTKIEMKEEISYPHSIGLLYSAFTHYLGFKVNDGEYKVMGLAPYGKPKYKQIILEHLIDLKKDGSFRINDKYFSYSTGLEMTNKKFERLFGFPRRLGNEKIYQHHMDVASSIQKVTEEILIKIVSYISTKYQSEYLCLAGGVALNCVANSEIIKNTQVKNLFVQPAAGDAGGSIGAAMAFWYMHLNNKRSISEGNSMQGSYLGPKYSDLEIKNFLYEKKISFKEYNNENLIQITAQQLAYGKTIGWFQGRMEFGPRALGNRSILADPRGVDVQKQLNLKIKFRESFRPFAPSILEEDFSEWFDTTTANDYMLTTSFIKKDKRKIIKKGQEELKGMDLLNIVRSEVPAVTHVDYSSRVQKINKNTNPRFYNLVKQFKEITGCPMIVNTSFNLKDEPIVCNPQDAFSCFMASGLDFLVMNNFMIKKEDMS